MPNGLANGSGYGATTTTPKVSNPTQTSSPTQLIKPKAPAPLNSPAWSSSPDSDLTPLLPAQLAPTNSEAAFDATDAELMRQKGYAEAIAPLRKDTHWLLVTLLLANTVVNETLPILFHSIDLDGWQAVLASTCLIVLFGEIVPQAVCARYGLAIGAFFARPVRMAQYLLYPVAKPIAIMLDWALGEGGEEGMWRYRRAELKELVLLHGPSHAQSSPNRRNSSSHTPGEPPLSADEVRLLRGVLEMRDKRVGEIHTPLEDVVAIGLDEMVDRKRLEEILSTGHSRIPVYHRNPSTIVGALLVKSLITINPDVAVSVRDLPVRRLPVVDRSMAVPRVLRVFEQGGSHMAVVVERERKLGEREKLVTLGIVTLEDVLEEILGEEIVDETDVFVNVHTRVPVTSRVVELPPLSPASSRHSSRRFGRRNRRTGGSWPGSQDGNPARDPMLLSKEELVAWTEAVEREDAKELGRLAEEAGERGAEDGARSTGDIEASAKEYQGHPTITLRVETDGVEQEHLKNEGWM
ncbi:hypothetical protein HDU93_008513 [Gonapodya sp. JEL0774]|nr:hypothetical protein HDU93_008513 [Gonapodya sp. JEL0774]